MTTPPDPDNPFGMFGPDMFAQLQKLMSWTGGPVNWDLAREVAETAARTDDRPVTAEETREIADAGRLADLWLDAVTTLPASGTELAAWSRTGWLTSTLHPWRQIVDPVAGQVTGALGKAMQSQFTGGEEVPAELGALLAGGQLAGMMNQIGGFVFGGLVGQALGTLAGEVLGTTEIGLPLGKPALVPANVAAFSDGLDVPADEVRLYLALREAAHQRLFAHVPWLSAHLVDAVDAYGRGLEIDMSGMQEALSGIDPMNPAALEEALQGGLFEPTQTDAQRAALARLENALALVEGWVDHVVDAAASGTLPHAAQLRETVRRRRASGGPAEQTFAQLVQLQLRPRRLREAAQMWGVLTERRGLDGRDALWSHPDLLPDLDDPDSWLGPAEESTTDWDAGLRALDKDLDGELDDDAQSPFGLDGPPGPPESDA
ncbi:MAG: hypothetical protein JWO22_296 [Frankiales bacterium]|nr:hypothetical protein [Frankiales bacterium]